jgi:hypothetical protein
VVDPISLDRGLGAPVKDPRLDPMPDKISLAEEVVKSIGHAEFHYNRFKKI